MMIYQYRVELDVDDDRTYTNGLCVLPSVMNLDWSAGMAQPYSQISNPAMLRITLSNADGRYDLEDENAAYYGLIHPGRLIRVRTLYDGSWETMTELRIIDVQESFGEFVTMPAVAIICQDKIKELLEFEYDPPLQTNVTTDEPLAEIHKTAEIVWPNNRSYFFIDEDEIDGAKQIYDLDDTDFDTGRTSLSWAGDHLGQAGQGNAQRLIRDMMKAEVFGMYFFQPRTGKYRFLNRLHAVNSVSSTTFRTDGDYMTQGQTSRGRNPYGLGPLNRLTLNYIPRTTGAAGSVLYTADNLPIILDPDTPKTIRARYYDPDTDDARVGGMDVITLQRGVDIVVNAHADGTGDDWTNRVAVSHEKNASSSTITVANDSNRRLYITVLQVRGTPLISYKREKVERDNGASFYAYDRFAAEESVPIEDESTVAAIADMLVNLFTEPTKVVERVSLVVTQAIAATVQGLTIGSAITVQNSNESHDEKYIIVGEQHRVQIGIGRHDVTYVLRNAAITSLFTIDTSLIDGQEVMDI